MLSLITLGAGIAITACEGVALHSYFESRGQAREWLLPIWPSEVDLRPTRMVLATGAVVAVFSLSYIIAAFAPLVRLLPLSILVFLR